MKERGMGGNSYDTRLPASSFDFFVADAGPIALQ